MKRAMMILSTAAVAGAAISVVSLSHDQDLKGDVVDVVRGVIAFQGIVYITMSIVAFSKSCIMLKKGEKQVAFSIRPFLAQLLASILLVYYASVEMFRLIVSGGEFAWWRSPVLFVAMAFADVWVIGLLFKFFPADANGDEATDK